MSLPFLPGYNIDTTAHSAKNFKKAHLFDHAHGTRLEPGNRIQKIQDEKTFFTNGTDPMAIANLSQDLKETTRPTAGSTMSRLPSWVAYDRKVIRFYGFFEEGVQASAAETWRIRKCVIQFYLEDDSIHITEPKVENSGIPQGAFVKRHRIPKPNNQYITLEDLFIGAELAIYGRVFKLVACDDFTRSFYISRDIQLSDNVDYPLDSFHSKTQFKKSDFKKQMNPLKKFMEADLGKSVRGSVEATKKFYDNSGKVLRFYASWNDNTMYGEKKTIYCALLLDG